MAGSGLRDSVQKWKFVLSCFPLEFPVCPPPGSRTKDGVGPSEDIDSVSAWMAVAVVVAGPRGCLYSCTYMIQELPLQSNHMFLGTLGNPPSIPYSVM